MSLLFLTLDQPVTIFICWKSTYRMLTKDYSFSNWLPHIIRILTFFSKIPTMAMAHLCYVLWNRNNCLTLIPLAVLTYSGSVGQTVSLQALRSLEKLFKFVMALLQTAYMTISREVKRNRNRKMFFHIYRMLWYPNRIHANMLLKRNKL